MTADELPKPVAYRVKLARPESGMTHIYAENERLLAYMQEPAEHLYTRADLDTVRAQERAQCAAMILMLYDEYSIALGPHRSSYDEGRLDALDIAEQRLRSPYCPT